MILAAGAPSGVFSLIYLQSLDQSRHGTYQMKAEYLTYRMVSFGIIAANTVENVANKEYKMFFYPYTFEFR